MIVIYIRSKIPFALAFRGELDTDEEFVRDGRGREEMLNIIHIVNARSCATMSTPPFATCIRSRASSGALSRYMHTRNEDKMSNPSH